MFERMARSWRLYLASWAVLRSNRQLLLLPLVSVLAAGAVIVVFAAGALGAWFAAGQPELRDVRVPGLGYAAAFAFYVVMYFIGFFFNAALVGAALEHFDGRTPTLAGALRIAGARAGHLLGWAVVAATVGVVLKAIQERVGFIGRIVIAFVGAGWTVATFLVVPVLVSRDVGPLDALKESAQVLRRTWGENVAGRAGMAFAFGIVHVGVVVACVGLVAGGVALQSGLMVALGVAVLVLATIVLALVHTALSGIYAAALYRFATGGALSAGFDGDAMQGAFRRK